MDNQSAMSRADKLALITPWINPEERITVQFALPRRYQHSGGMNRTRLDETKGALPREMSLSARPDHLPRKSTSQKDEACSWEDAQF
ncbi:MAG: hypothetical protein ACT4PN_07985 [Nitrospiraceae bacterium]